MKNENYTVWIGGIEITDFLVSKKLAIQIKNTWIAKGYNDCKIEKLKGV